MRPAAPPPTKNAMYDPKISPRAKALATWPPVLIGLLVASPMAATSAAQAPTCVYLGPMYRVCSSDPIVQEAAQRAYWWADGFASDVQDDVDQFMADRSKRAETLLTDIGYMGDEPNVYSSGRLPSPPYTAYPSDSNGISRALEGYEPVKVLNVKYGQACWPLASWCSLETLDRLLGTSVLYPGAAEFVAVYGWWTDLNGDGWIQNCQRDANVHPTLTTHRDVCRADEWIGIGTNRLVAYVSPGDWSQSGLETGGDPYPDIFFRHVGEGVYVSPGNLFPAQATVDGSLLQSVVVEAFVGQPVVLSGDRYYLAQEGEPVDVDLYRSLDPTVEALWTGDGVPVFEASESTLAEALGLLPDSTHPSSFDRYVGPAVGAATARYGADNDAGYSYEDGWHPYLDLRTVETAYVPTPGARTNTRTGGLESRGLKAATGWFRASSSFRAAPGSGTMPTATASSATHAPRTVARTPTTAGGRPIPTNTTTGPSSSECARNPSTRRSARKADTGPAARTSWGDGIPRPTTYPMDESTGMRPPVTFGCGSRATRGTSNSTRRNGSCSRRGPSWRRSTSVPTSSPFGSTGTASRWKNGCGTSTSCRGPRSSRPDSWPWTTTFP